MRQSKEREATAVAAGRETVRIRLDKVASAAKTAQVDSEVHLSSQIISREGYVLAVRVLGDKAVYNQMENLQGRMTRLKAGDQVAGVLGHRRALHGYAGDVPSHLEVGDHIHILNMGGVLGRCTSFNPDVGPPFEVEVLGAVLYFPYLGKRIGEHAHIGLQAIPDELDLNGSAPLVAVLGTCMNSGKTAAACEIIHGLSRAGLRVAGAKVTGVSLQRDVLNMIDYGAVEALSFMDAGVVSTSPESAPAAARRVLCRLNKSRPDVIVVEFGDGIFGEYGVQAILGDPDIAGRLRSVVLCANDPAGAWGAIRYLKSDFNLPVSVISGRVTDNAVGCSFVQDRLQLPAANALSRPDELARHVQEEITQNVAE